MKKATTILSFLVAPALTSAFESAFEFCNICGNGSADAFLPHKMGQIPSYEFIDTCESLRNLAASILIEKSPDCDEVQLLGTLCGCQVQEDPCQICGDQDAEGLNLDKVIPFIEIAGAPITLRNICCSAGYFRFRVYMGADSKAKQTALMWLPRISAILSFAGSSAILYDVLMIRRRKYCWFPDQIATMERLPLQQLEYRSTCADFSNPISDIL